MNAHYTKTTGINVCGIDDDSYDLEEPLHIVKVGEVTIQKFESAPAWTVINGQAAPENVRTDFGNFEAAGYAMKTTNGDVQAAIEKLREDGNMYDFVDNAWQAVIDWLIHNNNGEQSC